jgi:hypothetical protein
MRPVGDAAENQCEIAPKSRQNFSGFHRSIADLPGISVRSSGFVLRRFDLFDTETNTI